MAEFLFMAHSGLRYLVLLAGITAIVLSLAALGKREAGGAGRAYRLFVILLDVQVLLGIGVAFARPWHPMYIGHIVLMALAFATAHGFAVAFRRRAAQPKSAMLVLAGTVLALVLIVGGILAIGRRIL